ncbi:MAG: GAF domain-containing protein [Deltaproteobacteria bacterium]|nr:GAF domain-containing protein [Deltaproteobacteria bacterium]
MLLLAFLYAFNFVLVASGLLALRLPARDRVFSLSLLRFLSVLPLLTAQYLYLAHDLTTETARVVLLSEAQFSLVTVYTAFRLGRAMVATEREPVLLCLAEFIMGLVLFAGAWLLPPPWPPDAASLDFLVTNHGGSGYGFSLLALCSMLTMAWRLEIFWRNLEPIRRWEYKFLVVGCYLVCGSLVWATSYRLTYLRLNGDHFLLLACLLALAWFMMAYAVGRHRLLNRKLFISRTIVHASVAPFLLAIYLTGLGVAAFAGQMLGWSIQFVALGFLGALGCVAAALYWCSANLRKRIHRFISTHFYVNKYEYRDEWLALSIALRGAASEKEIVAALSELLSQCLYSRRIVIWLADREGTFQIASSTGSTPVREEGRGFASNHPLAAYAKGRGIFYLGDDGEEGWKEVAAVCGELLEKAGVVMMAPIAAGDAILGFIGVGEEETGGKFGLDDFDLLSTIGAQTASALLAARRAEELVRLKQRQVFETLSAFVLHDVKNAATLLSLVQANAADHIHDPEFQADMLEAVDNALQRMEKVQRHLSTLHGNTAPVKEQLEVCAFLEAFVERASKKFTGLQVDLECSAPLWAQMDKGFLDTILENLLLNALQAGGKGTTVRISACGNLAGELVMEVRDDGPGIPEDLLPHRLFEPFQTTRCGGSGIGLWQARELTAALGGNISAENRGTGACFVITIPGLGAAAPA